MKNLYLVIFILFLVQISFTLKTTFTKVKQANVVDENLDGLGTKVTKNRDNTLPVVISSPPYEVKECNQVVMFEADYITDLKDFRNRKQGFFVITVYKIDLFAEKNAEKLIHSVYFNQMKKMIEPLKGAKGCLILDGGNVTADMTICFKQDRFSETLNILDVFQQFSKCRKGDNLVELSDEKIKDLVSVCNQPTESTPTQNSTLNLKVRPNNKWDLEREKFFHPTPIQIPGTKAAESSSD